MLAWTSDANILDSSSSNFSGVSFSTTRPSFRTTMRSDCKMVATRCWNVRDKIVMVMTSFRYEQELFKTKYRKCIMYFRIIFIVQRLCWDQSLGSKNGVSALKVPQDSKSGNKGILPKPNVVSRNKWMQPIIRRHFFIISLYGDCESGGLWVPLHRHQRN